MHKKNPKLSPPAGQLVGRSVIILCESVSKNKMDKSTSLSLKALEHQVSQAVLVSRPTHGSLSVCLSLAVIERGSSCLGQFCELTLAMGTSVLGEAQLCWQGRVIHTVT